ncbi:site-specific DNA-methyltransferase [Campylobacter hyointestinalis]|uniref:site-specific DNA-methyltransferase (adenine-specific) n=1 Tax=Campylobacter hyointestinalis subsp. lawsonii TaxID=91353 RepID=A0AAV6ED22_CAMHY|nr:site-specific DNA-methyltransferase [Campylobacter hyointestinalis]KAB0611624.1 site-specific DNA-methyltransferase [Campylobacter hyointestinalis subsp. lawsonii]QKF69660.1 type III restriction/modification system, modification subunit [Campylobacter hyointestinalis subsp. lawsonii]RAZ27749.1 site-specific DNA-methyltransferase [Campylobacter hyointestinalis subsp. lawsonii]
MIDKNLIKEAKIKEPVKNEFYELLKSKFPQTINSDGAVNFDTIKMLLDIKVKENIKGYELNWTGKGLANALYTTPCDKELKFNKTKSKNTNSTQNIIIKGDNLDALKLLKSAYYEKIKMIYIDPPYNTKNDDFIYPDDFRKDYKQICIEIGLIKIEVDEFGNKTEVPSEAMDFFTSITSTKSHSGWLSFMLPRLKLARDLLKDDGVIFISIDDNEQANLKLLCDEIFGEENFVADFIRKTKSTTNDAKTGINYQHEFLYCYAKNKENVNLLGGQKDLSKYKNPDNDPNGAWVSSDPSAKSGTPQNGYFGVTNPYTGKVDYPPEGMFWRFSQNTIQKHIDEGRICFKKEHKDDERGFIYKRYLKDLKTDLTTFDSLKFVDNKFMNQSATKGLKELNMVEAFSYPKSVEFIQEIINHATNDNHDIILDFFAGSGTTAHAVMAQNAQDNGNRKFILVQLDEKIDEKKSKTAFDFCKNELGSKEPVISDITIERVKRAGNKLEKPNLDTGFCVYDLTDKDALIQKSDGTLDFYLNEDLTPLDKALNLALQSGKTIDIKSEEICKDKLYKFDDSYYIVSYDKNVLESLEATTDKPVYISGYNDIKLDDFLNLQSVLKDRLNVVY